MILDNGSFALGWRMGATKIRKIALKSQVFSLIRNFRWQKN